MRNFHFRLEKMLHFIRLKETMKKMEISSVQKRIDFQERRKAALQQSARDLLAGNHLTHFHITKIQLDVKDSEVMTQRITEDTVLLQKKQRELNHLMMRRKGLENLREKRRQEHNLNENRRAQSQADEMHWLRKARVG